MKVERRDGDVAIEAFLKILDSLLPDVRLQPPGDHRGRDEQSNDEDANGRPDPDQPSFLSPTHSCRLCDKGREIRPGLDVNP
jgi:hypothetical protein